MVFLGVLGLLGFIESSKSGSVCTGLNISITHACTDSLINEEVVRNRIGEASGELVNMNLRSIDFDHLEEALYSIPHVKHAAVYSTIDHEIQIEVSERRPIARIIDDESGVSALIDESGVLIPLSLIKAIRLPVFTGSFGLVNTLDWELKSVESSLLKPRLKAVYEMASEIDGNEFWQAQFQHLNFENNGDLVVYPQVGNHLIIFGTGQYKTKLEKLQTFYSQGMNGETWNKYKSVNLKYEDQIVCTKK